MRFRNYREQASLTQDELADISGVSIRTIQRIEQGHFPSLRVLSELATALEVDKELLKQSIPNRSRGSSDNDQEDRLLMNNKDDSTYDQSQKESFSMKRYLVAAPLVAFLAIVEYQYYALKLNSDILRQELHLLTDLVEQSIEAIDESDNLQLVLEEEIRRVENLYLSEIANSKQEVQELLENSDQQRNDIQTADSSALQNSVIPANTDSARSNQDYLDTDDTNIVEGNAQIPLFLNAESTDTKLAELSEETRNTFIDLVAEEYSNLIQQGPAPSGKFDLFIMQFEALLNANDRILDSLNSEQIDTIASFVSSSFTEFESSLEDEVVDQIPPAIRARFSEYLEVENNIHPRRRVI